MKIFELQEMLDTILDDYGDIDVCIDVRDTEQVYSVTQVLVETDKDETKQRALICSGEYVFKPYLTIVK